MSHPSRVRGLKCCMGPLRDDCIKMSHPSRVRGLKYRVNCVIYGTRYVAPFAGAWIEIICPGRARAGCDASHPSRVRGLKLITMSL